MSVQHHVINPQHGQEEKHQKAIQPGVLHAQSHIQHVKHRQPSSQASTKVLVRNLLQTDFRTGLWSECN